MKYMQIILIKRKRNLSEVSFDLLSDDQMKGFLNCVFEKKLFICKQHYLKVRGIMQSSTNTFSHKMHIHVFKMNIH